MMTTEADKLEIMYWKLRAARGDEAVSRLDEIVALPTTWALTLFSGPIQVVSQDSIRAIVNRKYDA